MYCALSPIPFIGQVLNRDYELVMREVGAGFTTIISYLRTDVTKPAPIKCDNFELTVLYPHL